MLVLIAQHLEVTIRKNKNTFAKLQRERQKKQKAEEKRQRKLQRKNDASDSLTETEENNSCDGEDSEKTKSSEQTKED